MSAVMLKTLLLRGALAGQKLRFLICCDESVLKAELCWFHQELLHTHKHSVMFFATWDMSEICA